MSHFQQDFCHLMIDQFLSAAMGIVECLASALSALQKERTVYLGSVYMLMIFYLPSQYCFTITFQHYICQAAACEISKMNLFVLSKKLSSIFKAFEFTIQFTMRVQILFMLHQTSKGFSNCFLSSINNISRPNHQEVNRSPV